ncbi:hypothetical protein [Acinetobacter sp. GN11]
MGHVVKIEASILEKIVEVAERIAQSKEERRVGRAEFAHMLNIEPETLDSRIREGRYQKPFKDGRKSYWMLSYVQSVVTDIKESDKVATY